MEAIANRIMEADTPGLPDCLTIVCNWFGDKQSGFAEGPMIVVTADNLPEMSKLTRDKLAVQSVLRAGYTLSKSLTESAAQNDDVRTESGNTSGTDTGINKVADDTGGGGDSSGAERTLPADDGNTANSDSGADTE